MAAPRLRVGARAVIFDPTDRVLLVHFRMPHIELWAPPGGGVNNGETLIDAVRRELHEEVGLPDADIGPAIWTRRHLFPLSDRYDGQADTFFLARVARVEPREALLTPQQLQEENVTTSAWWSLDDLLKSDELFAPRRLPQLVADLVANGPPDTPIDVGA